MLNQEQGYQENKNNFDEINNSIEKMGFSPTPVMKKDENNEEKLPFKTKLILFLIGFAYAGFLVIQLVWGFIFSFIKDKEVTYPVVVVTITYLSMFGAFVYFGIKNKKYFINKLKDPTKYLYGLICGLITIGIEMIIAYIINVLFPSDINANQKAVESYITAYPTLMFFITVVIGPLCEEITYRVGLFELLKEKNETMALIVSSLIFAFIHISFTDTTVIAEVTAFPIYLCIGLCLTYGYKKYGLPCSYIAHLSLNLISFLASMTQLAQG